MREIPRSPANACAGVEVRWLRRLHQGPTGAQQLPHQPPSARAAELQRATAPRVGVNHWSLAAPHSRPCTCCAADGARGAGARVRQQAHVRHQLPHAGGQRPALRVAGHVRKGAQRARVRPAAHLLHLPRDTPAPSPARACGPALMAAFMRGGGAGAGAVGAARRGQVAHLWAGRAGRRALEREQLPGRLHAPHGQRQRLCARRLCARWA